jgi:hypothetical protein
MPSTQLEVIYIKKMAWNSPVLEDRCELSHLWSPYCKAHSTVLEETKPLLQALFCTG